MEVTVQITINGLPEEAATPLGNTVGELIKVFASAASSLDLSRLSRVILTTNFGAALTELSQQKSIESSIIHTDEEYAVAVGKVLPFPLGQDYEIVLVFNAYVEGVRYYV